MSIRGVHTMFYTSDPEGMRAFIRDKLGFPFTDAGEGWLIFDLPEANMGCHPADDSGQEGQPSGTPYISFYCDDIHQTIHELKAKGVKFEGDVTDLGYGLGIDFMMPGNVRVQLYQPLHP